MYLCGVGWFSMLVINIEMGGRDRGPERYGLTA